MKRPTPCTKTSAQTTIAVALLVVGVAALPAQAEGFFREIKGADQGTGLFLSRGATMKRLLARLTTRQLEKMLEARKRMTKAEPLKRKLAKLQKAIEKIEKKIDRQESLAHASSPFS